MRTIVGDTVKKASLKKAIGLPTTRNAGSWVVGVVAGILQFGTLCIPVSSVEAEQYTLSAIEFQGNQRIDSQALRQNVVARPGTIDSEIIDRDIRSLFKTGFFEDVQARVGEGANGAVLTYYLVEKPVVRKVFITGNDELDEDDLAESLKFGEKRFVDKLEIAKVSRKVKAQYQQEGYYDAKIEHSVLPVDSGQVDVTFKVREGERYHIDQITFVGVKEIDEDELRDTILTKRYKWWSSWIFGTGRPNSEMLSNDKAILEQFLLDHGYVDGAVSEASIKKSGDGELEVTFQVTEGDQYKFGAIAASGDLIGNSQSFTLEGTKAESGDVFSATTLREDSFAISEKFGDKGYAFANVVPDTSINRDKKTVDLNYQTSKGKLVTVNRVNIRGNTKTFDNVIRRDIKVQEQQLYAGSKVKRSKELLERTGFFEEVDVVSEPVPGTDDKVDLNVRVREGSTGTFSVGAGFSSTDGAIFNTRLTERNFLGSGRNVDANIDVGQRRDSVILGVTDPRVNDSNWSAGVQGSLTDRQFNDFDRKVQGGSVSAGYPLENVFGSTFQDIFYRTEYEYNAVDIKNVSENAADIVKQSEGSSTSSSVTPGFLRNTINNPLNPTDGSRQQISSEFAGPGGNQEFYLAQASNQLYYPLFDSLLGQFTFSWRFRFGYGDSFNDELFPLFRRFFPGGINSVRGFKERTLGPRDENGREFGGSKEVVNNLEMIFPLIEQAGIKGVVFYDTGQAFDDSQSINFGELRKSYGYGIRWLSPLGPIRVEFGHPVSRLPGEDSVVTHFSFGAPL